MATNGRLSKSELGAIEGGMLRADAARAWNAMNAVSKARYGVTLRPTGSLSSYRSFDGQQKLWDLYRSGKGQLAATPGSSNHGLGLAVDCATPQMRSIIDKIGAPYGWSKKWSDAPTEYWHICWKPGVYKPPVARKLKPGSIGDSVRTLQRLLVAKNVKGAKITGHFGVVTTRAVKRFQSKHKLKADGVVGAQTWKQLRS